MSPIYLVLISIASIVGYGILAGVTAGVAERYALCDEDDAITIGLLWPIFLPLGLLLGMVVLPGAVLHVWLSGKAKK